MRRFLIAFLLVLTPTVFVGGQDAEQPPLVDYLIITADDFAEVAEEWADWRAAHGRVTRVRTLRAIAEAAGAQRAGLNDIKGEISDTARVQGKLTDGFQVLLLGAVPRENSETWNPTIEIPWRMTDHLDANPNPDRRKRVPTDNFYADLIRDADGMPDIAVGRVPARTVAQARLALDKVKAYESAVSGDWMRNLTFFAGEGRFGVMVDRMLENFFIQFAENSIDAAYNVRMTYANLNSSYAYVPSRFSRKVIEEANQGALLLTYMGHGLHDRLDNMDVNVGGKRLRYEILTRDDAAGFDIPEGRLPVMLIIACQTGYMDHRSGSLAEAICFAERGPVAVIGSSRDSHPYSNMLLQKAFVAEITERRRETLGEALLLAKRELIMAEDPERGLLDMVAAFAVPGGAAERTRLNRAHLALYNLTGDPGLRLRHPELSLGVRSARRTGGDKEGTELMAEVHGPVSMFGRDGARYAWEGVVESRRSEIPGELKAFRAADLTAEDEKTRNAAKEALAGNHATSNNKRIALVKIEIDGAGLDARNRFAAVHLSGKTDSPLAPGDYILKLTARGEDGASYGFTAVTLRIRE